jgi:cyclin B
MLISSKYEEIYAPEVRDFVYITDKAYTKEEILAMEQAILATLDFNVTSPSSYRFLERFSKIVKADDPLFNLARYLIELPLIEYRMLKYSPSNLAASALFLA